jgi:hypothetical protein
LRKVKRYSSIAMLRFKKAAAMFDSPRVDDMKQWKDSSVMEEVPAAPMDPPWKRIVRGTYTVAFVMIWIGMMCSFYVFGVAHRDGTSRPDATHTEPLDSHGHIVYIPHSQKALIDSLDKIGLIGIPSIVLSGLALNFFGAVKIFGNVPTLEEWKKRRLPK